MVSEEEVREFLAARRLPRKDAVLVLLAADASKAATVKALVARGVLLGIPEVKKWNVSQALKDSRGAAVKVPDGWVLTQQGRLKVQSLGLGGGVPALATSHAALRAHLAAISHADTVAFLDEAIKCLEAKLFRAAVVLTWVGAVSVLYHHVVAHRLADFNREAQRRDAKWRPAKTPDDLATMKEFDFLNILEALSTIGKSVKQELEGCLKLRNGSGHPNSLVVKEHRVASHIETLVDNVFARF